MSLSRDYLKFNSLNSSEEIDCCGVYRIIAPGGKTYIGSTIDSFFKRWSLHLVELNSLKRRHHCLGLQRAFDKYGTASLQFEILALFPERTGSEEFAKEIALREIAEWDNAVANGQKLYNGRPNGTTGTFHSEETKARIRASLGAKLLTEGEKLIIKARYLSGESPTVIAKDLKVSKAYAFQYVERENLLTKRLELGITSHGNRTVPTGRHDEFIVDWTSRKLNNEEIMAKYQINYKSLKRLVSSLGLNFNRKQSNTVIKGISSS